MNPIKFFTHNIFPFRVPKKKTLMQTKLQPDKETDEQSLRKDQHDIQKALLNWKMDLEARHFVNGPRF